MKWLNKVREVLKGIPPDKILRTDQAAKNLEEAFVRFENAIAINKVARDDFAETAKEMSKYLGGYKGKKDERT